MQMIETIMVAMVFMVVLIVALTFYFKFSSQGVEKAGQQACLVSNTVLLASVASMPEIQCSVNGHRQQCIDTSKLLLFDATREYPEFFTTNCHQRVSFLVLSPEATNGACSLGTYPDCSTYVFFDQGEVSSGAVKISTPVSLYYPLTDSYALGKLQVEVLQ
ncbi:hypothetical protein HZA98_00530 [Candidatus Woesearchaeota archaeon]|nr:hypothetical protein [Candidatus Woesearchaeota archaeon]